MKGEGGTVSEGHYARKQLGCKSWAVAFSHRARFRKAVALVGRHPGDKLLDYGCGDGTFLGMVTDRFAQCVGADVAADQVADCEKRYQDRRNLRFCVTSQLATPEHRGAYRIVTCMETLEHCTEPLVDGILADLARLVAPQGTVVISVPIETGLSFPLKYAVRTVAAWRGLSEYRFYERYSFGDALRMVFATSATVIRRPVYGEPGAHFHSHYGFNWRRLHRRIERSFRVEQIAFSPLGRLGGWVSSQVWFVCRPHGDVVEPR